MLPKKIKQIEKPKVNFRIEEKQLTFSLYVAVNKKLQD